MTKLIAAALVVACALTINYAQERPEPRPMFGRGTSNLPFEVVSVNGESGWKVTGRGSVSVEDLLGGLANATNLRVSFSARAGDSKRINLSYLASDSGMTLENKALAGYCGELMGAQQLALVGFTTGRATVARIEEAAGLAVLVTEAELAGIDGAEWVTVNLPIVNVTSRDAEKLLALYRATPMTTVDYPGGVVVSGPAERVRAAARLLRDMDKPGAGLGMVRAYDLQDSVKATAAREALLALFPGETSEARVVEGSILLSKSATPRVTVAAASTSRLIVFASTADHALVQQALTALK